MAEEFRTLMGHLERLYCSPLPREKLIPAAKATWLAEENLRELQLAAAPPDILEQAEKRLVKLASKAPPAILIYKSMPVSLVVPSIRTRNGAGTTITKFNWLNAPACSIKVEYYLDGNILHCCPHMRISYNPDVLIDLNRESEINKLETMALAIRDIVQWVWPNKL